MFGEVRGARDGRAVARVRGAPGDPPLHGFGVDIDDLRELLGGQTS
jgi:hypothetical protein